jgi:hypothetical protein
MTTTAPKPRTCGSCTLCCKVMGVRELAKPIGTWCSHCTPGQGCGIHGSHPETCSAFACQWLVTPSLSRHFRPDQCKVVLNWDADSLCLVANCDPANPFAWRREPVYGLLKAKAREVFGSDTAILAKAGLRLWLITPDAEEDLGDMEPGAPLQIGKDQTGRLHLKTLPVPADMDENWILAATPVVAGPK